jgi:phosphatidylinositol alpha-mannosyltransferase
VPNGVDVDVFCPPTLDRSGPITFGFAGRLVAGKGVDRLIEAHARVASRAPAKLVIAGDGPLRATLQARSAALRGSDEGAQFVGSVSDMPSFWRSVDVGVFANDQLIESFGIAALEAMATGRPVIVSALGALSALVSSGVTGTIVPAGDVDALERAMLDYLDREVVTVRGAAAREQVVARFSLDRCLQQYLAIAERGA